MRFPFLFSLLLTRVLILILIFVLCGGCRWQTDDVSENARSHWKQIKSYDAVPEGSLVSPENEP
ncbi:MAG: hypothetical protein LBJ67_17885 [Planctomycetaceae bacterium]|jgi:hypothetical protein|nr:hypothetical protein [Planctomycetaceae bacterium]